MTMTEDNENLDIKDYRFYFPVAVWFDNGEPRFQVDADVQFVDGFVFNEKEDKWEKPVSGSLADLDEKAFLCLMEKLTNVSLFLEES